MKQNLVRELLAEVHGRLPAGQRRVQEAFTTDHRRPVLERLLTAAPDQFYFWEEIPARTFCDAIWDYAGQQGGDRLTILDPFPSEVQTHAHRFQKLARRVQSIRVLSPGDCGALAVQVHGLECRNITGTALTRYRGAVVDGSQPVLFLAREAERRGPDGARWLGFFSFDPVILEQLGEEIGAVAHGMARRLATFEKLETLHRTTQQVTRELESYSRRVEQAAAVARRRPDLMTPARFNRIVSQAVVKMEELKEIPRRALRNMSRPKR